MTRLGGRKFIGFAVLVGAGLYLALKGAAIDVNVVALLLGSYGVFAGTNLMAGRQPQPKPEEAAAYGDQQVADFLNSNLVPQINQLITNHQATAEGVNKLAEQVVALSQPKTAEQRKATADEYRKMLAQSDAALLGE